MVQSKARLLAAGVSILALGEIAPTPLYAVQNPGVIQNGDHNLYTVPVGITEYGEDVAISNPGAPAATSALVNCATGALCGMGAIVQHASNLAGTERDNRISVEGSGDLAARAQAIGSQAVAQANIQPYAVEQHAAFATEASNGFQVALHGSMNIAATAVATATEGAANANARIFIGAIDQSLAAVSGFAENSVDVRGDLSIGVVAVAHAQATTAAQIGMALAQLGFGIRQTALNSDNLNSLTNSGTLEISASASVNTDPDDGGAGFASAAIGTGIYQQGVVNVIDNEGTLIIAADAVGEGAEFGIPDAAYGAANGQIGTAIYQFGFESQSILNEGTLQISVDARGIAHGAQASGGGAFANASLFAGIGQIGFDLAAEDITNNGHMSIAVGASAVNHGTIGYGFANAEILGAAIQQDVTTVDPQASGRVSNSGTMEIAAHAQAAAAEDAMSFARALGVSQTIDGPEGSVTFSNEANAIFELTATAQADGGAGAMAVTAQATAIGVFQEIIGSAPEYSFANGGDFAVSALARAVADPVAGAVADADAIAEGYSVVGDILPLQVANAGDLEVSAIASAPSGSAFAGARGISAFSPGDLANEVTNANDLRVFASAVGNGATQETAAAVGISLASFAGHNETVTNSGAIDVRAVTSSGGTTLAIGVQAAGLIGGPGTTFTLNNSGSIFAAESRDGGTTWTHGTALAIGTASPAVVNLFGGGDIYGDIDIAAADVINVSSGETAFDGIVNPAFVGTETDDDLGQAFEGALNIASGGTLYLRDNRSAAFASMYDGPAKVYVNSFNVAAGGTLALELPVSADPAVADDAYPQVFANSATLAGTLDIRPSLGAPVLLADSYFFDNVIEADALSGRFDAVTVLGGGALFNAVALYPEDGAGPANVDLRISRTAFDVGCGNFGGTLNMCSTAGGIENVYGVGLSGPFADLVSTLFTLNQVDYLDALDQLAGAQYASYLQALRNNSFQISQTVSGQIDCAVGPEGGIDGCRDRDGGRVWARGGYGWLKTDGDAEASAYDGGGFSGLIGADYSFGTFTVGAFAGYRDLDLDFAAFGGRMEASGWQLGAYAAYDVGSFYIRGIASHQRLDGDSERRIDIGTIAGTVNGDPDAGIWSFYAEAGGRFDLGGSWITPYAAAEQAGARLKSFDETGLPGVNLGFEGQKETQFSGLLGVKWASNFGGIVPEVNFAWRHDFNSERFELLTLFADAPAGSGHRIVSPEIGKNSAIAGISLGGSFSQTLTGRLGYQGRYNKDARDHSLFGTLTLSFGGGG